MTKKILYVEDEPDIQTIAQIALETVGGFTVKVCSSGEEVLREVDNFAPDIVLLDVMMPGMDGLETFQKLRQLPQHVSLPVVFMTARVQPAEIQHYRDLGAIDVIAKPFDAMTLSNQVHAIFNTLEESNSVKQLRLQQLLGILRKTYRYELPTKMAAINDEWRRLKYQPSALLTQSLIRKIHSLGGSGATFELPAVSKAAQNLEAALRSYDTCTDPMPLDQYLALEVLVQDLEQAILDAADENPETSPTSFVLTQQNAQKHKRVALVCDNKAEAVTLSAQLAHFAIRTELTESAQELADKLEQTEPDVILIESSTASGLHARIDKMERIKTLLMQPAALIMVSSDDTMDSRLSAVRSGAAAYFLSPVKIAELVDFIRLQIFNNDITPYRILIVDDDDQQANHTALTLMQAGMESRVVTEPMKVLDTLVSFQPELILMDLHMPECNGLELAAVIRQYSNYTGIAIVFFSMDNDIDRHIDALRAGGDEFLVKSLSPLRLLALVEARVKRSRLIQKLMLRDGLTGLLNRSSIDEHLLLEINKIKRLSGCFSYIILDLDYFKQINDRYGHLAGDEVLKALGLFLLQRLRAIDLIGRYGGEEIVIILPGTDAIQALALVNKLLQNFSDLKFLGKGNEFSVTFSAGIAEYPYFNDIATLIEAADQAMYLAKAEGRNRACIATLSQG